VGKDEELVLGYIITHREYRMFNEKGIMVRMWDQDEIDVQDCWNFKKYDDAAKWHNIEEKNRESGLV
jgi:hypothetical protein